MLAHGKMNIFCLYRVANGYRNKIIIMNHCTGTVAANEIKTVSSNSLHLTKFKTGI